jgi:hypothetical protein
MAVLSIRNCKQMFWKLNSSSGERMLLIQTTTNGIIIKEELNYVTTRVVKYKREMSTAQLKATINY